MRNYDKKIVVSALLLAVISIALGAFGAHGLKEMVSADAINSFETGVRYQMYHALALLVIGFAMGVPAKTRIWVFRFFIFGIVLFSGSIYLLSIKEILPFNISFLGPVTPIGGLLLIIGWLRFLYGIITTKKV